VHIPPRILEGDFAGWLRDAMNERGMSPRMLGLQAGIDPRCVAQILYGGREPTIATALTSFAFSERSHLHPQRRARWCRISRCPETDRPARSCRRGRQPLAVPPAHLIEGNAPGDANGVYTDCEAVNP
jgi:hypothetical protein